MPSKKLKVGEQHGRLTVIELLDVNGWRGRSLCRCACGVTRPMSNSGILQGRSRSCGCLRRERVAEACRKTGGTNRKFAEEESNCRYLYNRYKSGAKRNAREFALDFSTFKTLTSAVCHYCGIAPSGCYMHQGTKIPYYYNGLDRKDPDCGYTEENAVPACGNCNLAKRNMAYLQFLQLVSSIYNRLCAAK